MEIRRALTRALAVSLCFAALVAIVALLTGSFNDTDWRLIGTSVSFAAYSALAASGAAVRPKAPTLGAATMGVVAVAWLLLLALIWVDSEGDALARTCGVATIAALAGSHASIVLRDVRASDTPAISALVAASIALAALDALSGALVVSGAVDDDGLGTEARLMAVTVVLLLLTTALPPILRRASPARSPRRGDVLERLAGEVVAATERIERLDDPGAVRLECRRLRELARSLGG